MRIPFLCCFASSALSLALLAGGSGVPAQAQTPASKGAVGLEVVKYADLGKAIRAHQGKVVVVDAWATWCPPCVREFPHLVELHDKYAAEGLVCVSVSMDGPPNRENALKFLTKSKAGFPNYLLEEDMKFAADRWNINGIPAVFVFRRDGKRAAKFDNDDPDKPFSYEKDVEPLVRTLLAAKE